MTSTLHPLDAAEGRILWIKVALAMWTGVIGPVLEPYPYIPLHPEVCRTERLDNLLHNLCL